MAKGTSHHAAQLTPAKVRAIRRLCEEHGWKVNCLANAYKVSYNTVWDVINYNTWRHVR